MGVIALWTVLQFDTELRYFFREPTLGDTPQSKIAGFMDAVRRDDQSTAFDYWEIGTQAEDDLK